MGFSVVVLGSGTVVPVAGRAPSAHLVLADGANVLLDCGPATALRLADAGCSPDDVDAVAITHLHGDHSTGLVALLQGMWSHPRFRRSRRLAVAGPARLEEVLSHCADAWPSVGRAVAELVDFHRWSDGPLEVGPLSISPVRVPHTDDSVAFRVAGPGGLLVYSGDCDDPRALAEAARGADLLLVECAALPDSPDNAPHLRPDQVALAAKQAGVGRVVLVHITPDIDRDEARSVIALVAPTELADDLSRYDIP